MAQAQEIADFQEPEEKEKWTQLDALVAQELQRMRMAATLSTAMLEEQSDGWISEARINEYEHGNGEPVTAGELYRITEVFGTTPDELLKLCLAR